MRLVAVVIGLSLLKSVVSHADAPPGETVEPFKEDVTLTATRRSVDYAVFTHGRQAQLTASIRFALSEVVSPGLSTLAMWVDGTPVRTASLDTFLTGGDTGVLEGVGTVRSSGFHTLSFRADLKVKDDPCLERYRDATWIKILKGSTVRVEESDADGHYTVTNFRRKVKRREVHLGFVGKPTDGSSLAALEAMDLLSQWQATPVYRPDTALRVTFELGDPGGLRGAPDVSGVIGALTVRAAELEVVAKDWAAVAESLRALRVGDTAELCPQESSGELACFLTAVVSSHNRAPDGDTSPPGQVLSFKDLGYMEGWTARGSGEHVLRWVWNVPPTVTLTSEPEIHVRGRIPHHHRMSRERSGMSLLVNGKPFANWRVPEGGERFLLKAKLPQYVLDRPAWSLELQVNLVSEEAERCKAEDESLLWIHFEPQSGLWVPRQERRYAGIARFYLQSTRERPGIKAFSAQDWSSVVVLGQLLRPFVAQTPTQGWSWARTRHQKVIIPKLIPKTPWWKDTQGDFGHAIMSLRETIVFEHREGKGGREELHVVTVVQAPPKDPVHYPSLVGKTALYHANKWRVGKVAGKPQEVVDVVIPHTEDGARQASVEEQDHLRFNVIWGIASLVTVAAVTALLMRRRAA